MGKSIKYIVISLIMSLLVSIIILVILNKVKAIAIEDASVQTGVKISDTEDEILVIGIESPKEDEGQGEQNTSSEGQNNQTTNQSNNQGNQGKNNTQNKPQSGAQNSGQSNNGGEQNTTVQEEPKKDDATLTQEIYNLNSTIGTLYIPKTKLKISVYCNSDSAKLEKMPGFLYTTGGLNKTGTTLFVGHNRRNGRIFSNNKKLQIGDIFYFTDYEGKQLKYTIYSKFIASSSDVSFLNNQVDSPTIALSCCTDASDDNRIIILGAAK